MFPHATYETMTLCSRCKAEVAAEPAAEAPSPEEAPKPTSTRRRRSAAPPPEAKDFAKIYAAALIGLPPSTKLTLARRAARQGLHIDDETPAPAMQEAVNELIASGKDAYHARLDKSRARRAAAVTK